MRRMTFYIVASVVMTLAMAVLGAGGASAAVGDQLILNAGLETGSGGTPSSWSFDSWSTGNTIRSAGTWSTDAHGGTHSVRVDVTAYGSDGDAKWTPQPFAVTGGKYYVFSDWYKSNRSSAVSVEYWTAGQSLESDGQWANLFSGIASASGWTQYQTGFTMPAGAVYATFVHFIAGVGWLETDDYSVTEQAELPGFSSPMISLTFDDGSGGWFNDARVRLNAKGFKTTQYIPTLGLTTNPPDSFMMTKAQISQAAGEGHEIGAHSVTHPDLTTVSDTQLKSEVVDSKATLEAIAGVGTVTDFAYPYGTYDARVIAALKAAGYTSGRSVEEGYNSQLDLSPYDIRVQNMTPSVSLATFQGWIDYAKAHNYWLVIVYHEVQPDNTRRCGNVPTDPDPCVGDYDTTDSQFQAQLDYISTAGLGADVMTVKQALQVATGGQGHPPVAGTVALSPAQPATNDMVTATAAGFSDPDGDALTYTYTWKVNGNAVATSTSAATTATFDLSQAGHGDHGDTVSVTVSASDGHGNTSAGISASVTVANTAPTVGSVSISPSAPSTNATLTATPTGFADLDGDALAYRYQWSLNGTAVPGATAATFTPSGVARGAVIGVTASADDGHGGTTAPVSATVTIADTAPVAGSVSLSPASPQHGATVTATPTGFTDADGDMLAYHYQWSLNGTAGGGRHRLDIRAVLGGSRRCRRGDGVRRRRPRRHQRGRQRQPDGGEHRTGRRLGVDQPVRAERQRNADGDPERVRRRGP